MCEAEAESELLAIRKSRVRDAPFDSPKWAAKPLTKLGLEATIRQLDGLAIIWTYSRRLYPNIFHVDWAVASAYKYEYEFVFVF